MEDHAEKKRELELAQKKIKEYKDFLKGERKKRLKEKFSKLSVFIKLKPWIVWNSILTIMVLVLFIGAYTSNPNPTVNEENKVGSFLGNIFGFLGKDENVTTQVSSVNENVEENNTVTSEQQTTPATDNDLQITVTNPSDEDEEVEPINFDIWVEYNEQEFSTIETSIDNFIYHVVIENKEDFDFKCEGDNYKDNSVESPSNVEVVSYSQRSIFTQVKSSEAGSNNKTTMKHEFTCYDVDESIDKGTKKQVTATIIFK